MSTIRGDSHIKTSSVAMTLFNALISLFCLITTQAYHPTTSLRRISAYQWPQIYKTCRISTVIKEAEDGVDLSALIDINEDKTYIRDGMTHWLNSQYFKDNIHSRIGLEISEIYGQLRLKDQINDLGELMLNMGTVLENNSNLKSADYVNPWDIANKLSDLLMIRLGRELCSCDEVPSDATVSAAQVSEVNKYNESKQFISRFEDLTRKLSSEFQRYTFLQAFFDNKVAWSDLRIAFALIIGFRYDEESRRIIRFSDLAPHGWTQYPEGVGNDGLIEIPSESMLQSDAQLGDMMEADLPNDDNSIKILMDQVIGADRYKMSLKQKSDALLQRKLLLLSWFYTQGFLEYEFPFTERFIPGHQMDLYEENE